MALNTGVLGGFNYVHITAAAPTTTTVKSGEGILHTIGINTPADGGTVTIYDSLTGSGEVIAIYTSGASTLPSSVVYDIHFKIGLTVVTASAAQDITASYV